MHRCVFNCIYVINIFFSNKLKKLLLAQFPVPSTLLMHANELIRMHGNY